MQGPHSILLPLGFQTPTPWLVVQCAMQYSIHCTEGTIYSVCSRDSCSLYVHGLSQLWDSESGKCYQTFRGHTAEIVCLSFNPQSTLIATGSMDTTAKLWNIADGKELHTLAVR